MYSKPFFNVKFMFYVYVYFKFMFYDNVFKDCHPCPGCPHSQVLGLSPLSWLSPVTGPRTVTPVLAVPIHRS